MSVIGDYVHSTAKGYIDHGILRKKKSSPLSELSTARNKMLLKATQVKVNNSKVKQLQDEYNSYKSILANLNTTDMKRIRGLIIESLIKQYSKDIPHHVLDETEFYFESGKIGAPMTGSEDDKIKRVQQVGQNQWNYQKTIENRILSAERQLSSIKNAATKEILSQQIAKAKADLQQAVAQGGKTAQEAGLKGFTIPKGYFKTDIVIPNDKAAKILQELRESMVLMSIPNLSNWIGAFEEIIARYCALKAEHVANDKIIDIFEQELQTGGKIQTAGSNRVAIDLDQKQLVSLNQNLLKSIKKIEAAAKTSIKVNNDKFAINIASSTESKADAWFSIDSTGTPSSMIGASIKNIDMSVPNFDITLVSGSPLLYFLMGMGDNKTATHYLNILADHEIDDDRTAEFNLLRKVGIEGLSYHILYSALSGRGSGRTGGFADIFILNDNSKKKNSAKFYDVGTLISGIVKTQSLESVQIKTSEGKMLQNLRLYNEIISAVNVSSTKYIKTGVLIQRRLTALLLDAHQQKITVALSKNIFRNPAIIT